tara:strand:- start:312 stop:941 length:630 start_codon:yes stop_codon:yes gene_type:complete
MLTQELKVPNKLEELTLGQYQKFNKALSGDPDNDFLHKKTIEIFCGVDMAEVSNYKYTSITQVVGILNKMFEEKPKLINRFNHNGKEYGFVPKLDDLTFGEFVDLDLLMGDWETMDEAFGILYREVKDSKKNKYTIVDYNPNKTISMEFMPLNVALGALFFLQSLNEELTSHMLDYLEKEAKNLPTPQREYLTKTLDGIPLSTQLVMQI